MYEERINHPCMEYYRHIYKDSPKWDGKALEGKRIVIYCEQGAGDIIQFARYFKFIDGYVILHCPESLCSLMRLVEGVDEVCDKEAGPPEHDCHVLSMSLPHLLGILHVNAPYLAVTPLELPEGRKVGIAWEGSPGNPLNAQRNCPLRYFKGMEGLYMLQDKIYDPSLVEGAEDLVLNGVYLNDFMDTACLIAAMDYVITVDTSVLHLAGAMGKKCYGLLCYDHDARWLWTNWYPSVKIIKQLSSGDWGSVFKQLALVMA